MKLNANQFEVVYGAICIRYKLGISAESFILEKLYFKTTPANEGIERTNIFLS